MHNLNAVLLAAEMEPRLFDLDFQLLADSLLTIIAVFVLFIALSYLLFNPARKFMQDRQNKIAGNWIMQRQPGGRRKAESRLRSQTCQCGQRGG